MDVCRNEAKSLGKGIPRVRIGCLPIDGFRRNVVSSDTENRGVVCMGWEADHATTVFADEEARRRPLEEVLDEVGDRENSEGMVERLQGEV